MRDNHHGHAAAGKLHHDVQYLVDHLRIKRAGRLVEHHRLGVHGERAGDGDALLLAAGELGGRLGGLLGHAHAGEQLHGAGLRLVLLHPQHLDGA